MINDHPHPLLLPDETIPSEFSSGLVARPKIRHEYGEVKPLMLLHFGFEIPVPEIMAK